MLDVGLSEFFVIGAVALLVVGPKELPALMARVGRWTGKARAMARHARSGWDAMVREAEIEEMNKRWEAENARIMAATEGRTFPDPRGPEAGAQPDAPGPAAAAASAQAAAGAADVDTFLPGLDGGMAEDRNRPAAAAPDAPDPTDWRDPPLMRPLGPAAAPPAAAPPAAAPPAATEAPAAAPAPAVRAPGDATASDPAPARPRRARKTGTAAPPAAPRS